MRKACFYYINYNNNIVNTHNIKSTENENHFSDYTTITIHIAALIAIYFFLKQGSLGRFFWNKLGFILCFVAVLRGK